MDSIAVRWEHITVASSVAYGSQGRARGLDLGSRPIRRLRRLNVVLNITRGSYRGHAAGCPARMKTSPASAIFTPAAYWDIVPATTGGK